MGLPSRRYHPDSGLELILSAPVKKGTILKPGGPVDARMVGRPTSRDTKGPVVIAGHDGEKGEIVVCYEWLFLEGEWPEDKLVILADDGEFKPKAKIVAADRVVGETVEGGVLLWPSAW